MNLPRFVRLAFGLVAVLAMIFAFSPAPAVALDTGPAAILLLPYLGDADTQTFGADVQAVMVTNGYFTASAASNLSIAVYHPMAIAFDNNEPATSVEVAFVDAFKDVAIGNEAFQANRVIGDGLDVKKLA